MIPLPLISITKNSTTHSRHFPNYTHQFISNSIDSPYPQKYAIHFFGQFLTNIPSNFKFQWQKIKCVWSNYGFYERISGSEFQWKVGGWEHDNTKEEDPWDEYDWEKLWATFRLDGLGEVLLYWVWFYDMSSSGASSDPIDEY